MRSSAEERGGLVTREEVPDAMPGPYKRIQLGVESIPLYMLRFDAAGAGLSSLTCKALIRDLRQGGYTHVFVCAHGWNNTFGVALSRYEQFITGYHAFRQAHRLAITPPYRPVVIGITWPSIDLLLPGERPPRIASTPDAPDPADPAAADPGDLSRMVAEIAGLVPSEHADRLRELGGRESLDLPDAAELAGLLALTYPADGEGGDDADGGDTAPVTAATVLSVWRDLRGAGSGDTNSGDPESFHAPLDDLPQYADAPPGATASSPGPRAAARVRLDPRPILRAVTVCKMKDRAGIVGSEGVAPLLADVLAASPADAVHLVGHSYGCRLLLAALSTTALPRPASSLLLLQPAVNYLCFATQVPKTGRPGGFRRALDQVRQPVLATFSARDAALHVFFHLAVRRRADLGEPIIAAPGHVPSLYCALGGWGPGGMADGEVAEITLLAYPQPYHLSPDCPVRVYGVRADAGIGGHSDVVNDFTFWALHNQVTG
jgi:hypothetical protein